MKRDVQVVRDSIERIVAMLTARSLKVTMRGTQARVAYHPVTGAIINVNIPYIPDDASDEFIAAIQGFLDHEVGHVLHSDVEVLKLAAKAGKRVMNMANVIEDVYIERKMTETFRGSAANLDVLRGFYFDKVIRSNINEALTKGDVEAARGFATVIAFRAWGGQSFAQDMLREPAMAALVDPIAKKLGKLTDEIRRCSSSMECLELAKKCVKALETVKPPPPPPTPAPTPAPVTEPEPEPEDAGDVEAEIPPAPEPTTEPAPPAEPGEDDEDLGDDDAQPGAPSTPGREEEDDAPEDDESQQEGEDQPGPGADDEGEGKGGGDDDALPEDDQEDAGDEGEQDDGGDPDPDPEPEGEDLGDTAAEASPGDPAAEASPGDPDPEPEGEDLGDAQAEGGDGESPVQRGGEEDDAPPPEDHSGKLGERDDDALPPKSSGEEPPAVEEEPDEDLGHLADVEQDFDKEVSDALSASAAKEMAAADYRVYSTEWDKIEPAPKAYRSESVKEMIDEVQAAVGLMQKHLERAMAARHRKAWNPGMRRGRINPGALFRTGTGDDRVFRTRTETQARNTAVSLLVDCSGSMRKDRNLATAGTAAYALSSTLERLKIKNEVLGFTTHEQENGIYDGISEERAAGIHVRYSRDEPIYMPVFKSFNERLDADAKARIAVMRELPGWMNENIDGESLLTAAHRLRQQTAERHVLIVLSDGQPACGGVSSALANHLRQTVKSLESSGIEVIGIGLNTDVVQQFYRKSLVLRDTGELPTTLIGQLTKLLLED